MIQTCVLNQYRNICSDVLNKLATKLNKSFKSFLMGTLIYIWLFRIGLISFRWEGLANRVSNDSGRTSQRIMIGWNLTCLYLKGYQPVNAKQ